MIPISSFSDELIKMAQKHKDKLRKISGEEMMDRDAFQQQLDSQQSTGGGPHPSLNSYSKTAEDEGITGQQAAVGAAAASPFAGLIGQQKFRHDPLRNKNVKRYGSMAELGRMAQEGDVILTSKKGGIWKNFQAPLSGSEFYHAQPVMGRRGGMGTTASAGDFLRGYHKMTPAADFKHEVDTIPRNMKDGKYQDMMIVRPKEKLNPQQMKTFRDQISARVQSQYDMDRASGAYLRDIFVPKVGPFKRKQEATEVKYRNVKDPATGKINKVPVRCKGNVCSTAPAQAFTEATGKSVIPGKAAQDVLPADFLRSDSYKPVGAVVKGNYGVRRAQPYIARAGIGAGLAGATYAATEDPALVAGLGGAAGASAIQSKILRSKAKAKGLSPNRTRTYMRDKMPSAGWTVDNVMNPENAKAMRKSMGQYAAKNLSVKAMGGVSAYLAAKKLLALRKERASK